MKRFISFIVFCVVFSVLFSCGKTSTEKCLQKEGYQDCEHLKKAFNLQNKDEAIKYHAIAVKCGCKEE